MNEYLINRIKQNGINEINKLKQTQNSIYSEIEFTNQRLNNIIKSSDKLTEDFQQENKEALGSSKRTLKIVFALLELTVIFFLTYRFNVKELDLLLQIPFTLRLGIFIFYVISVFLFFDFKWCSSLSSLFLGLLFFSFFISFFNIENIIIQLIILTISEALIFFIKRLRFTPIWGLFSLFALKVLLNYTSSLVILLLPLSMIVLSIVLFNKIEIISLYLKKIIGLFLFFNFKTVFSLIINLEMGFNFSLLSTIDNIFYLPQELINFNWLNLIMLTLLIVINIIKFILEKKMEKINSL